MTCPSVVFAGEVRTMPETTLHVSNVAARNLVHSISTTLPTWVRMDAPDFIKEGKFRVWFNPGANKTH